MQEVLEARSFMSRAKSSLNESPIKTGKAPLALFLLNGVALVAIGTGILLTQHFYSVRSGTAGFKSFCNINDSMNCDLVAASPRAELVLGLPISSFATGWFLALFVISLIAHQRFWRREAIRACAGLALLGSIISFSYLIIMATQIKTYCLLCLGMDGLSALALASVWVLRPEGLSQHRPKLSQWKVFALIVGGSLLFSVLTLKWALYEESFPEATISDTVKAILETPVVSVRTSDDPLSIGPANAPITLVEFSDFQCPFCRIAAYNINSVVNRYPHKIKIIFRNFPLNQACNSNVQQTAHPIACEAARAALCAHKQGKFEETYKKLFQEQATFAPGRPLEITREIMKLSRQDPLQIQGCMDSPEVKTAIARDVEEGTVLGVQSTPTFFINGHRVEGAMPIAVWIQLIDHLLESSPHHEVNR